MKNVPRALTDGGWCLPFLQHLEMGHSASGESDNVDCLFPDGTHGLENAAGQVFGFLVLLVTSAQFIVQFAMSGKMDWESRTVGGTIGTIFFGVVLFNFALVIAIPAWLEREPHVTYRLSLMEAGFAVIPCFSIGMVCHLAVPHVSRYARVHDVRRL
jgi:hypothetical protein